MKIEAKIKFIEPIMHIKERIKKVIFLIPLYFATFANAQLATSFTPEQMQMLQRLPASQREMLISQYAGMDFSALTSSSGTSSPRLTESMPIPSRDFVFGDSLSLNNQLATQQLMQSQLKPKGLQRFGLSLFAGSPYTFNPLDNVPVPSDYVLGPGDEIIVQLYGQENTQHKLRVQRSGNINFPNLDSIAVHGLTFSQVQTLLSRRIADQFIGVRSSISLGELRSMQIFVLGFAYKPGAYSVSALTTVSQAIYLSGGFNDAGALRNVQVKRNGKTIRTVDMYDLLLKGNTNNDIRLQEGDTVFIGSVSKTVKIDGEINQPAIYELKTNEKLEDIIQMAGGLTSNALLENVQIKRQTNNGLARIINVNYSQAAGKAVNLIKNDEVFIAKRGNVLQNFINIEGDVINPGVMQWRNGLRVSDVLTSIDGAFHETADLSYALIVRSVGRQKEIKVLQFNIANAVLNPNSKDNISLQSKDRIIVFNRFELTEDAETNNASSTAKSFEQAQNQSDLEKQRVDQALNEEVNLSSEKLELISRDSSESTLTDSTSEKIEQNELTTRLKATNRKTLLAPLLLQLEQQSRADKPLLIAEVMGEIKIPGRYPITENAKIKDIILAAGGLKVNAYLSHAELSRSITNSDSQHISTRVIQVALAKAMENDSQANLSLASGDKLNILAKPGSNQLERTVTLQGEVRFPGVYTIAEDETLRDVIARAGGLTRHAYSEGAIFTREALRLQEERLLQAYAADIRKETVNKVVGSYTNNFSSLLANPDNTLALIEEASKSNAIGRMVIQLDDIIADNTFANFLLEDDDFLFIPRFKNTISIVGEVQVAVTYMLNDSMDIDDYINKAGGLKKQADEDRIYVMRADGSVYKPENSYWFNRDAQKLKAGDTIIVPLDTSYRDQLTLWQAATQILYQTGVAVNAITR